MKTGMTNSPWNWNAPLTRRDWLLALALVLAVAFAAFQWGQVHTRVNVVAGQRAERGRVRQELIRFQRRHEKQRQRRVKPGPVRSHTRMAGIVPVVNASR